MQPFAPRPTTFLGVYQHEGWRLKSYGITFGPAPFDAGSFAPGLALALAELPPTARAPGRFGVGFTIQHRGRGADYVVLAWWDRENELPLRVFVREQSGAATWRRAGPSESVCVWDLELIAFE